MGNSQSHVKEEDPVDYRKKGREDRDRQYDEFKRALEENRRQATSVISIEKKDNTRQSNGRKSAQARQSWPYSSHLSRPDRLNQSGAEPQIAANRDASTAYRTRTSNAASQTQRQSLRATASDGSDDSEEDGEVLRSFQPRKEPRQKHSDRTSSSESGEVSEEPRTEHRAAAPPTLEHNATNTKPDISAHNAKASRKSGKSAAGLPAKRAAASDEASSEAERQRDLARRPIPKRPKASIDDLASPQSVDSDNEGRPPKWYKNLTRDNKRSRNQSSGVDVLLQRLKAHIEKAQKVAKTGRKAELEAIFNEVRERLHVLVFEKVDGQILRNTKMLDNESGLPQIFDKAYAAGVQWPYDIKADAEELYNKWSRRDFDVDIMRGIDTSGSADKLLHGYKRIASNYHGNGDLLNGQWWPIQLAALRDGAHGSAQAGIWGHSGEGAYSCVVSGGHGYPDEDHGDWILYCGTDSQNGEVTAATQRMLESVGGRPVRVIRSSNLVKQGKYGKYAPEIGFRYDGLYDVVELVSKEEGSRQRHQFKLVRCQGQDPIRGGEGPEKRPTRQEVDAYKKHKQLKGRPA